MYFNDMMKQIQQLDFQITVKTMDREEFDKIANILNQKGYSSKFFYIKNVTKVIHETKFKFWKKTYTDTYTYFYGIYELGGMILE